MPGIIRNTRQREAIRQAFEDAGRPLTPEQVLASARAAVSGLGIATVYRNIRTLIDEGWLVPVDLPGDSTRYELAGKAHHHHFHCRGCGEVFELAGCAVHLREMVPPGFEIIGHEVVLYGFCGSCNAAGRTKAS
jgi:Fur family ferric uptake transcriptional regulator